MICKDLLRVTYEKNYFKHKFFTIDGWIYDIRLVYKNMSEIFSQPTTYHKFKGDSKFTKISYAQLYRYSK